MKDSTGKGSREFYQKRPKSWQNH